MKKTTHKLCLAMIAAAFLGMADVKAQTWTIPTNGATVGATDYIGINGTGTNQDVIFKTGSTPSEAFRITSSGSLLANGTSGTTPTSGSGTRLMWIPAKGAFRAGGVSNTDWDDTNIGSYSTAVGYTTAAIGDYSFAAGYSSGALGLGAVAIGAENSAQNSYSTSLGYGSTTNGQYALSAGTDNNIQGDQTYVFGQYLSTPSGQTGAIVIGSGSSSTSRLASVASNSLTVAFGGTTAAFTIKGYGSTSTTYAAGDVGIGTSTPAYNLDVAGNINYSGNLTNVSDQRYKINITPLSNSLRKIDSLRAVSYNFNQNAFPEKRFDDKLHLGFIAQEIQKVFPELVSTDKQGYLAVNYVGLIPVLVSALQEQKATIDSLKKIMYATSSNSRLSSNVSDNIPSTTQLFQNVPNPFDQTTTISYSVPSTATQVSIIIFNMLGTQIQRFDNLQTGNGQLQFDGTKLGAGMYLYSLIVDNKEVDTKRMILTK